MSIFWNLPLFLISGVIDCRHKNNSSLQFLGIFHWLSKKKKKKDLQASSLNNNEKNPWKTDLLRNLKYYWSFRVENIRESYFNANW